MESKKLAKPRKNGAFSTRQEMCIRDRVSPPFGGLEKYSFLGKRRPLRHSDTPEGKIAAFRLIVVGKTSDFRLVSGQF